MTTSLRQFTINALNQHRGVDATKRFGTRWAAWRISTATASPTG